MQMVFGALKLVTAVGCSLMALAVNATPITLQGDSVNYVYDNTQAAMALYGTPTIVGDVVRFMPSSFRAQSLNGSGIQALISEFVFSSIYSHNGADITKVEVSEFGNYRIINGDGVGENLLLSINNKNASESTSNQNSFSANGGSSGLKTWNLSATVDPGSVFDSSANNISASIQSTFSATTDANAEGAWVQKQLIFVSVLAAEKPPVTTDTETPIPAPGVVWLLGAGLFAWGVASRKRR